MPPRDCASEPVGLKVPVFGSYTWAAVPQPPASSTRPSANRVAVSPIEPSFATVGAPVQVNPGARAGIGVGDGVGAGGPMTATCDSGVHGGGTIAAPPSGCHAGVLNPALSGATPIAAADITIAAFAPSASIVQKPADAPLRVNRIRPSAVQLGDREPPSSVNRRTSEPSARIV